MKTIKKIKSIENIIANSETLVQDKNIQLTVSDEEILAMEDKAEQIDSKISELLVDSISSTIGKTVDAPLAKTQDSTKKASLEDKISSIDEEFRDDTSIDISNLREKSQMESAIKGKWASKVMTEKVKGIRMKEKLSKLCSGLEKMYSESRTVPSSYLNSKRITESMLNENTDVRNLRIAIEENKIVVEYLEKLWTAIQGFGYTLKNSIESAKLEMGI